jgi:transcriptional regulator with XRE-family HTH domain
MFDLKAFRAEAKLTQTELADLWGLRPEMLSRWENGDMPAIAEYAARALKADLDSKPIVAKLPPQPEPAPAAPAEKARRRLGRLPEAMIQGISNA